MAIPIVYNKSSASKALGISTETLDRYRRSGKLPFRRIGDRILFTESDLTAFLDGCAVPVTANLTSREKLEMAKVIRGKNENTAGNP
jgi:excisionase family DNA binding protein